MDQYILALITGITTGGLSCFAIQGGLLASAAATNEKLSKLRLVNLFFIAKLIAITGLGFLLGLLGERIAISPTVQGYMQIFAGIYMVITAMGLLNVHPIFKKLQITAPKRFFKYSRTLSRDDGQFAPIVLGASTVLIPCGITQSMMLLAIASGNPVNGALIMGIYTLGTAPVFYALGLATGKFIKNKAFLVFASLMILIFGLMTINTGQVLRGSVHTFQNYYEAAFSTQAAQYNNVAGIQNGVQEVVINAVTGGYESDVTTLKANVPVRLNVVTQNTQGCSRSFTIPSLGYSAILPETGTETFEFTPTKTGRLAYTCSMGMYTGYFNVI